MRGAITRDCDAVQLGVQPQVLLGGEVAVERGVLEDEADVAADVVALGDDVVAATRALPPVGRASVHSMLIVVALAGAVGAEEAEHLAAARPRS